MLKTVVAALKKKSKKKNNFLNYLIRKFNEQRLFDINLMNVFTVTSSNECVLAELKYESLSF